MLVVAEELAADAQDHRPVPGHQRGEGGLGGGVAAGDESLERVGGRRARRPSRRRRATRSAGPRTLSSPAPWPRAPLTETWVHLILLLDTARSPVVLSRVARKRGHHGRPLSIRPRDHPRWHRVLPRQWRCRTNPYSRFDLERLKLGLHTQALRRPEGPQEPSPGRIPGNRSPRALLVHPEGVPGGLLRPFRPPEIWGVLRTPGFTRGWAPAALQAEGDRLSLCAQPISSAALETADHGSRGSEMNHGIH